MNSCIREITELVFNTNSGIAIIRVNPNAIMIEEEIRNNHLVIGSNSIQKNKL